MNVVYFTRYMSKNSCGQFYFPTRGLILRQMSENVRTFQHLDCNSLAGGEFVNPEGRGLHHFSKSSVAQSFTWQREKS